MFSRNRQDPRRHRRRKERRLPRRRRGLEDDIEVLGEPHVEHLVGLVEHQQLDRIELQRPPFQMIERAARRGDHDMGAAFEGADLLMHRRAAVKGQHRKADALRVLVDRFGDLHRELARRYQHDAAGLIRTGTAFADPLQHRQRKRRGLAGAGAGLAEEVAPLEQQRDRLALHRGRFFITKRRDGVGELALQAKRSKTERLFRSGHLTRSYSNPQPASYASPHQRRIGRARVQNRRDSRRLSLLGRSASRWPGSGNGVASRALGHPCASAGWLRVGELRRDSAAILGPRSHARRIPRPRRNSAVVRARFVRSAPARTAARLVFASGSRRNAPLSLVQAGENLGELDGERLAALLPARTPVTASSSRLDAKHGRRSVRPIPRRSWRSPAAAIRRCRFSPRRCSDCSKSIRLPSNGLSRTEQQLLVSVALGARTRHAIYRQSQSFERRIARGETRRCSFVWTDWPMDRIR